MTVAVCTNNSMIKELLQKKDDIDVFFSDDTEIEVQEYDLVMVDIALCKSKSDIAAMQSSRTVYILAEITEQSIDRVLYNFRVGEHPFTYTFYGKEHTVDLNDIVYFESKHKIVRGYNEEGAFIRFYNKLDEVQKKVDDFVYFIRVNKSHLVNYNYCTIEKDKVTVIGKEIRISRKYKKELKKQLDIIKRI